MSFLKRIKSKTDRANARKEKACKKEQRETKRYERTEIREVKRWVKYEAERGSHICTFWCNQQGTVSYFQDGGFKVRVEPHKGYIGKFYVEVEWD